MKYMYDCEFVEDGKTIDLVSIGIVAEDGREFYAVSSEFDIRKLGADPWLVENVLPSIPTFKHGPGVRCACPPCGHIDTEDPDVRNRAQIARAVLAFLRAGDGPIELWAWYAAYDHVALCQLWGRMIDLPDGMPMYTRDLKQECDRQGNPELPEQAEGVHNALGDARHNVVRARALGLL